MELTVGDAAAAEQAARDAHARGDALTLRFAVGLPGQSAEQVNETLALAHDLYTRFGAWPEVSWGPADTAALDASTLAAFRQTFDALMDASRGPRKVVMNVTYACNNHCTFCAVGTRTQVHGNPERQREWLALYRERGVTLVDFDGGEPTLDPDLVPLVRHARAIGYTRINVTTNGRMCFYESYARSR
jgi:uncharacterized radical SAM superfamily Fe-S cluster-containing enzyme